MATDQRFVDRIGERDRRDVAGAEHQGDFRDRGILQLAVKIAMPFARLGSLHEDRIGRDATEDQTIP